MPDAGRSEGGPSPSNSSPLVRREVVLLAVLCGVAVALFVLTRALASWSHETMAHEAAAAYERGRQAEAQGDLATAIAELRRAVLDDRENRTYARQLARVLAEAGRRDEAERLLLRLREATPDDAEINYRLARIAVRRGDVAVAVRYYNHAMYGLAADGAELDRRRIRVELVNVLLDAGDRDGAVAELAALGRELPDQAEAHLEAGRLAARAGQQTVALQRFRRAAALDPAMAEAHAGAGSAALALHDFRAAADHFETALRQGASGERLTSGLAVARLAQATDPLAPGLPIAERARRLDTGLEWVAERLSSCPAAASSAPGGSLEPERAALERLRRQPVAALRDSDVITEGAGVIGRVHAAIARACPDRAPLSDAWTLIAQAHPGEA